MWLSAETDFDVHTKLFRNVKKQIHTQIKDSQIHKHMYLKESAFFIKIKSVCCDIYLCTYKPLAMCETFETSLMQTESQIHRELSVAN